MQNLARELVLQNLTLQNRARRARATQSPAEFYKGKIITIMLGHPPGDSYEL